MNIQVGKIEAKEHAEHRSGVYAELFPMFIMVKAELINIIS